MVKALFRYKEILFIFIILFFIGFSFYPTYYDLTNAGKLGDPDREFILEHNYYWPDYNLYLSKIRQGFEGGLTALEKYTSEPHSGSLIQIFYVYLGLLGRIFGMEPNYSYLLGRLILSPVLLFIILMFVRFYFKSFNLRTIALITVIVSASFPRFYMEDGILHVGRYMEWWSNIDALQRITFIPHILFGQIVSFYLLYHLLLKRQSLTKSRLLYFIILGNLVGLVFPPSLITLWSVVLMVAVMKFAVWLKVHKNQFQIPAVLNLLILNFKSDILFLAGVVPSLLYFFIITKFVPWSSLVEFHRTHPMMIPFDQYILGTGPVFYLGLGGTIAAVFKRAKNLYPLIFWLIITFFFSILFTHVKDQSPLRFTQTGLFIPLGILAVFFFQWLYSLSEVSFVGNLKIISKLAVFIIISVYIIENFYMMIVSLNWQTTWIGQRIRATQPPVPYPPQAMYPLKSWMDGIRWLKTHTNHNDVVIAEITAANYIPAYSGNTVYFGQSNTVNYEKKQVEVGNFFDGKMQHDEASAFLANGRIKYIFVSVQEKERLAGRTLESLYPFIKPVFVNPQVTIYQF